MANPKPLFEIILKWEGGWSDHPADRGGKTNMGVTLQTWKDCGYDKDGDGIIDDKDLKLLTKDDVFLVFKKYYWDRWKADQIASQSIANIVVDWVWASGKYGITRVQKLLGVTADGIVGPKTLASINQANARNLFQLIKEDRIRFVEELVSRNPSQNVFKKGWLNRINSFTYSD